MTYSIFLFDNLTRALCTAQNGFLIDLKTSEDLKEIGKYKISLTLYSNTILQITKSKFIELTTRINYIVTSILDHPMH